MAEPPRIPSCRRLLRHFQGIVYFNAKVSNSAFQVCMVKQQLYRSDVLRPSID